MQATQGLLGNDGSTAVEVKITASVEGIFLPSVAKVPFSDRLEVGKALGGEGWHLKNAHIGII